MLINSVRAYNVAASIELHNIAIGDFYRVKK